MWVIVGAYSGTNFDLLQASYVQRWGIASMLIRAALVTLPAAALFGAIAAWIAAQVPGVAR